MRLVFRRGALGVLMIAAHLGSPGQAIADATYDDAFRRAVVLEAEGDPSAALAVLEPLVDSHPDDYALFLQLGWISFQLGDFEGAEAYYKRASTLSRGGAEPELGLAWVYLRTDRPDEALEAFNRVVAVRPEDASALQGRALALEAARALRLYVNGSVTLHLYSGNPFKEWALGLAPSLDARIARRMLVGGTYRYAVYAVEDTRAGQGRGRGSRQEMISQHQVHARVGAAWPFFGLMAHFAWAQDNVVLSNETWVTGLSFRLSPFGDIFGEVSVSIVDDATVVRGALAWGLPAGDRVILQPGFAVIRSIEGELQPAVNLLIRVRFEDSSFWVGGRYGRVERPAYLGLALVYNNIDELLGGLFAGVRFETRSSLYAYLAYEWQAVETPLERGLVRSNAHFLTVGLGGAP
ncbi:MAG: tetratricopeptide repeat protein [Polyangiales bacterium]